jgi:hypothetical protein
VCALSPALKMSFAANWLFCAAPGNRLAGGTQRCAGAPAEAVSRSLEPSAFLAQRVCVRHGHHPRSAYHHLQQRRGRGPGVLSRRSRVSVCGCGTWLADFRPATRRDRGAPLRRERRARVLSDVRRRPSPPRGYGGEERRVLTGGRAALGIYRSAHPARRGKLGVYQPKHPSPIQPAKKART